LETQCTDLEMDNADLTKFRLPRLMGWSGLEKANALATALPFSLLEGEAR
jgi:hypothetical protein